MLNLDEEILMKYKIAIYNFEEIYIKNIYSKQNENIKNKGYLVKLEDFKNLKEKIKYSYFEINYKNDDSEKVQLNEYEKKFFIQQIEFNTSRYLLNMIDNGNEYIIINENLWKVVCDKGKENEPYFEYEINSNNIILNLDNYKNLNFTNYSHNNIINKYYFKRDFNSDYDKIKKLYKNIKKYYEFEKKFLNDLKGKRENSSYSEKSGYLISKDWIENWKEYCFYEDIKNNYLEKNIKEEITLNKLIYNLEKSNFKYNELSKIKTNEFKTKIDLELFLKNESLVLVNNDFVNSFSDNYFYNNNNDKLKYKIYENKIFIYLDQILIFNSQDNIISLTNENTNIINLK